MKKQSGLTLIEILISSVILLMLLSAIGDLFLTQEKAFFKVQSQSDSERFEAVILNNLSRKIRITDFVTQGSNLSLSSEIPFPPILYHNYRIAETNFSGYLSAEEHWITLAKDSLASQVETVHFYRPLGRDGGSIYLYDGPHRDPWELAGLNTGIRSSPSNPIENLEMWATRTVVVMRLTMRDQAGGIFQNTDAVYLRCGD